MSIQLLNKRILLKQVKKADNGLIMPNEVDYYLVAYLGKEVKAVKKGDSVLYENGRKFLVKGEEYILTDEENIVLCLK